MPLYRFEIIQGDSPEVVEVECDSIEHMRAEALRMAEDCLKDLRADFWDRPRWALRVTNESNMSILSLTFTADV
jgi:hypothetical protein